MNESPYQAWLEPTLREIYKMRDHISAEHNRQMVGGVLTADSIIPVASSIYAPYGKFQRYVVDLMTDDVSAHHLAGGDDLLGVWFMYPHIRGEYTENIEEMYFFVEVATYGTEETSNWTAEFPPQWSSRDDMCFINTVGDFDWEF